MFTTIYAFACDECGERVEIQASQHASRHEIVARPSEPQGWAWIEGMLICPKHKFEIRIIPA